MKYYIYENEKLKEVPDEVYEKWDASPYILPPFFVPVNDLIYTLETRYHGAIDDYEEVLPFVIVWFKDELMLKNNMKGVIQKYRQDEIEYFETFEDMETRYYELKENWLRLAAN